MKPQERLMANVSRVSSVIQAENDFEMALKRKND